MTIIQSILFKKASGWNISMAIGWLQMHGYKHGKVDVTTNLLRFRQVEPVQGAKYRIKPIGDGIELVILYLG